MMAERREGMPEVKFSDAALDYIKKRTNTVTLLVTAVRS